MAKASKHVKSFINSDDDDKFVKIPKRKIQDIDLPKGYNADKTVEHQMTLLTKRQKQIYRYLITSLSLREIAEKIFISAGTLKLHLTDIYRRLKVKNRVQLTTELLENEHKLKFQNGSHYDEKA